ncbi:hypothetical protein FJT64_025547 [Amphibalanus amphitrite]|uniref:Uncharacterized protein n=1 Tax=Amphibalanus amphitrite TaxID=1232801 RepID=A0A6A4W345_AMPAM|nr:hypothetical protein FJT64_025547 [Amphibalanus amphitrite]
MEQDLDPILGTLKEWVIKGKLPQKKKLKKCHRDLRQLARFFDQVEIEEGMEKRLRDLEEKLSELSTVSSRSCSGCMALTLRVEELERRLGPEPEARPELSITITGNPTGAAAGDTFDEQDPVDLLLREAQQLAADGDLEDLFQLETLTTGSSTTPTPTGDADQLEGDTDQPTGDADQPAGDADQPMGDADQPARAPVSRCHLILGDSIAKYFSPSVASQDSVLNLAEGGP